MGRDLDVDSVTLLLGVILFIAGVILGLTNTEINLSAARESRPDNYEPECSVSKPCPPTGALCEDGDVNTACIYPSECIEGVCELQGPPTLCDVCLPGFCGAECDSDAYCQAFYGITYTCNGCVCGAPV